MLLSGLGVRGGVFYVSVFYVSFSVGQHLGVGLGLGGLGLWGVHRKVGALEMGR